MSPSRSIRVRVHYPDADARIVLRTDADWDRDLAPRRTAGRIHEFDVPATKAFHYFKPVRVDGDGRRWSRGDNHLALASRNRVDVHPHFGEDAACSVCAVHELEDAAGVKHSYRVFFPPGYAENTLKRYPVLYMQDGQNLFFPDEAYGGHHWKVEETLKLLSGMSACEEVLVVGVYPNDRMREYTRPGYAAYGRFLAKTLKPAVDRDFRTLPGPGHTAVMGSSLGGVVSFHLAWEYPHLFGKAACLSSTFGYRDDFARRVARGKKRPVVFYLDSGWPGDNYEVTRDMAQLLRQRGYEDGRDLVCYAWPHARHDEHHWAMRSHIPYQIFFGRG